MTTQQLAKADQRLGIITWILVAIAVVLIGLGIWSANLTSRQNGSLDKIQQSRIDITWKNCQDQNARHDATLSQLDRQLLLALHVKPADIPPTLAALEVKIQKAGKGTSRFGRQLVQTHNFTSLLIEALAPHQDCAEQLNQRFGRGHRAPSIS